MSKTILLALALTVIGLSIFVLMRGTAPRREVVPVQTEDTTITESSPAPSETPNTPQCIGNGKVDSVQISKTTYESRWVKIEFPASWTITSHLECFAGESLDSQGNLVLAKSNYRFYLHYKGIGTGGAGWRSPDYFSSIPWLEDPNTAWECASSMMNTSQIQVVNSELKFHNIVLDENNAGLKSCQLPSGIKNRWFGGYFKFASAQYPWRRLIPSQPSERLYVLEFAGETPGDFPSLNDPGLNNIRREAIGIVQTIEYK